MENVAKGMPGMDKSAIIEQQDRRVKEQLTRIRHKIMVMSGKGGVGKSSVAVNLAVGLSLQDFMVGLLDVDLHGPNVPKMLGLRRAHLPRRPDGRIGPVVYSPNLKFLSIEPLLPEEDSAIIWRGPLKISAIKQFIGDIDWGKLDYLVIDAPPGTGDEPMTIAQTIPDAYALLVTTPQEVSLIDVKKSYNFCKKVKMRILGLVENMSGFICPHCGKEVDLFKRGGGERLAEELGIKFLGRIPVDPRVVAAGDSGKPMIAAFPESKTAEAFEELVRNVVAATEELLKDIEEGRFMRVAVPVEGPLVTDKADEASMFAIYDVEKGVVKVKDVVPKPDDAPMDLWLKEQVITHLLTPQISKKLKESLTNMGVHVIENIPAKMKSDMAVQDLIAGVIKK
ncbi:ATPase-like, ParA/MinD [Thermodesulfatator indicus DSM 15286]|uniref:Iron-sulfur cluster carrier protein n=1 Tax=Thermodesulfatator indicus (strain DSM 15286 / JCM 11887 / CIR29812) TaxID=667014 RepID=F8A8H7_THEID|nr:Mrp/NBP35 family ATP-binding protein [Thermodesulfatator indicus]AEH43987.1 ATPase-like, ParA/MinD [Thermodesulfatator indicus DSM 15286]